MASIENNTAGFVKIPRVIFKESWAQQPSCLALFLHLVDQANLESKEWDGLHIERGQVITSRSKLMEKTGLSAKQVRNALAKLEKCGWTKQKAYSGAKPFRSVEAGNRAKSFTIITICNYDNYSGRTTVHCQEEGQGLECEKTKRKAKRKAATKEIIKNYIISHYLDPYFDEVFSEWLEYREEIGKPLNSDKSILASLSDLCNLSSSNADTAREIVRRSIANGWHGLFEIKDAGTQQRAVSKKTTPSRLHINSNDIFNTSF